jgi:hypothetical protein
MRLLERRSDGRLCLGDFTQENLPPYGILSHTWGADEVTFRDLMEDIRENKTECQTKVGYQKIAFCEAQALSDGLQYFWVDTCCIDKSSSAELQESINRMCHWYRCATRCYAYLSDVSSRERESGDEVSRATWKIAFRKSRWFTRGWTLQELVAPKSVEFFSKEGIRLGDKLSLEQLIHDITGIPSNALRGGSLSSFSVSERMAWVAKRNTQLEEDKAYSLFGIFDIQIPLLYGEGEEKAFTRLHEEIDKASKSE